MTTEARCECFLEQAIMTRREACLYPASKRYTMKSKASKMNTLISIVAEAASLRRHKPPVTNWPGTVQSVIDFISPHGLTASTD